MKLEYGPNPFIGNDMFITFSDANHGGDKDYGKSTSGYMVKLGSGVVCWQSMEICWVQNLLQKLGYTPSAPAKLYMDNQSAMSGEKSRASWSYEALGSLLLLVARSSCDQENPTFI